MALKREKNAIPTYVLPSMSQYLNRGDNNSKKRPLSSSSSSSSSTSFNDSKPNSKPRFQDISKDDDIKSIYQNIKEFNANELKGKERLQLKQDRLTELGAPPPKQHRFPFKIQMAKLRGKAKREVEMKDVLKESGLVISNKTYGSFIQKKKEKKIKHSGNDSKQPQFKVNMKKGVLHVKKGK